MTVAYYSPSRRAYMALGESIDHLTVFERDEWVCGICKGDINPRLRGDSWWRATLDHIKPRRCFDDEPHLWHTYANVQASHWKCNMDKSDQAC